MKRYIIVLPDGREVLFFGDERAAWVIAQAYGGSLKETDPAPETESGEGGDESGTGGAEAPLEEGAKSRRKR